MTSSLSWAFGVVVVGLAACAVEASPVLSGALIAPDSATPEPLRSSDSLPAADLLPVLYPGWEAQAVSAVGPSSLLDGLGDLSADVGAAPAAPQVSAASGWRED